MSRKSKTEEKDIAILKVIKDKVRATRQEISQETGLHPSNVAYRLELLIAMGYACKTARGVYEITDEGKALIWRKKVAEEDENGECDN